MATGHVPKPACFERRYPADQGGGIMARVNAIAGQNCLEMDRRIKGTAHHTEDGWFLGTSFWFLNPANGALTDYQIGGEWDGPWDGVIERFIEPEQGVAPFANGRVGEVRLPFGEAAEFIQDWVGNDLDQINARARSIELSDGKQPNRTRLLTGRQIESLSYLTAWIHSEEVGQAHDAFDDNFQHFQTGTSHQTCPGQWLKDNKAAVLKRASDIMRGYQLNVKLSRPILFTYPPGFTGKAITQPGFAAAENPFAKPVVPSWLRDPEELAKGIDRQISNVKVYASRRAWRTLRSTPRWRDSAMSAIVGPPIPANRTFIAEFVYQASNEWWVLTAHGTRVRMKDLTPTARFNV